MRRLLRWGILCCGLWALPGWGSIIFQDDFSGDAAGLGKTTLVNWNVLNSTNVDVGGFGALCGPGPAQCIDTQGSGGNSNADIETKSAFALGPGFTYTIHFTLNNGGGTNVFRLVIGTAFNQLISTATSPDGTYNLNFTAASQNATIRITDQGPADNVGVYLGHIQLLSTAVGGVPEPGTIGITTLALGAVFLLRRKAIASK